MHEFSLAEQLWHTIQKVAKDEKLKSVSSLKVSLGECLGVVPESLKFCWEAITEGTFAEGSALDLKIKKPAGLCKDCGSKTALERPLYLCKSCGSSRIDFKTGREFLLESVEGE